MSDYGLTLPEHDLTAAEFKDLARRLGRAAFVPLFLKFYERIVTSEATIEEQRKALVDISRWTGVEEEKKTDPNANLPVFNFVFGVGARAVEATLVQEALPTELATIEAQDIQALDAIVHPHEEPDHGKGLSLPDTAASADEPVVESAKRPHGAKPRERHRDRPLPAGATPVPLRAASPAGAPALQDGVPVLGGTKTQEVDTLASALASLDAALDGL